MTTLVLSSQMNPVVSRHCAEWEDEMGFGPCGAVALARRMQKGWGIVMGYRHRPDQDPFFGWPHYVSRLPDGTLLDETNPLSETDTCFSIDEDAELPPHEIPDVATEQYARWWLEKGL